MSRNELGEETSPYLLQHRDNPVHWRAWSRRVFDEAKATNRPILLSVGYAACHWCHVMAHESFEDEDIARLMNEHFIPVKVDREERPDIDSIYQTALALLGQSGGWPLTMFLTPEGEPFWGGTYFPPEPRYGRPSFPQVLAAVADSFQNRPDTVTSNVGALREALREQAQPQPGPPISVAALDIAAGALLRMIDPARGGLGGAPKFPQTAVLGLLWRSHWRRGDESARNAVLLSLNHMCQGGIYDHLGGGFARYSTDAEWLVPHFEKMLYDNAGLLEMLTSAWLATHDPLYARRVEETVGWLQREMIAEHGAFAATLDADSEGEEGKYYVWRKDEIEAALGPDRAAGFCRVYGVTAAGNWEDTNILHRNHEAGRFDPAAEAALVEPRAILLALRRKRVPPGRDDKILADWNGMIIAALACAAFAFDRPAWLAAAERAFQAVATIMVRGGRLGHSLRQGRLQSDAMLDDYAQMARAALALYETTGDPAMLQHAENWVATVNEHYRDRQGGGYFFTADDAEGLIVRTRSALDHAYPSGNATMVEVLARLFHITGRDEYRRDAESLVGAFAGEVGRHFPSMAALLNAWELLEGAVKVTLSGRDGDPHHAALLRVIAEEATPLLVIERIASDDRAAAIVCRGNACSLPIADSEELRGALKRD